nr:hypothetical protein Iba_chr08bCG8330 [Ipomoea batatas]
MAFLYVSWISLWHVISTSANRINSAYHGRALNHRSLLFSEHTSAGGSGSPYNLAGCAFLYALHQLSEAIRKLARVSNNLHPLSSPEIDPNASGDLCIAQDSRKPRVDPVSEYPVCTENSYRLWGTAPGMVVNIMFIVCSDYEVSVGYAPEYSATTLPVAYVGSTDVRITCGSDH